VTQENQRGRVSRWLVQGTLQLADVYNLGIEDADHVEARK